MIIPPKSAHFSAGFTHDLCQQPSLDHVWVEQKLPGVNPEGWDVLKSPNSSDFFHCAIYNKFAFINHWIQERMGKIMVGMRRNDMNQTSITTVFYTTPCGQCSVLFLASRRNSAQRCAPKWCSLLTRLTLKRKLSRAKSSMQMIFHHAMMTSMKLQGCASSIWPLKSKEERSWKCHSSWNQINWKPNCFNPPHMTTGGKLLKFTLQDQGNEQSKKSTLQVQSSIFID